MHVYMPELKLTSHEFYQKGKQSFTDMVATLPLPSEHMVTTVRHNSKVMCSAPPDNMLHRACVSNTNIQFLRDATFKT